MRSSQALKINLNEAALSSGHANLCPRAAAGTCCCWSALRDAAAIIRSGSAKLMPSPALRESLALCAADWEGGGSDGADPFPKTPLVPA